MFNDEDDDDDDDDDDDGERKCVRVCTRNMYRKREKKLVYKWSVQV